jgi:hypothetical protein
MWVCAKNIVYTEKMHDLHYLRERIYAVVATVAPDIPCHTWVKIKYGLNVCRPTEVLTLRLPVKERKL